MTLALGTRLGPYEVLASLGAGGMGEVYRARDMRLDRQVAVKVLPEAFFEHEERRARFEREARLLAALSHPNIAAVHSFEEVEGRHVLVMELLEGESLRDRLRRGALPPHNAVELGIGIAHGLAAAHAKGIVHRDVKPANVFVTKTGVVKLLDFGLAKIVRAEDVAVQDGTTADRGPDTEHGAVMGTLGYTSPEQLRGETVDARTDIFAFGCVLFEMLGGKPPFLKKTAAESVAAIMNEDPPPLHGAGGPVPPALQEIVGRCLEKKIEDRYSTAHDVALALRGAVTPGGITATPLPALRPRPPSRKAPKKASVALVAAGLLFAVAGVLVLAGRRSPDAPLAGLVGRARLKEVFSTLGAVDAVALSPDATMLAYVLESGERTDLFVARTAGGPSIRLTDDEAREAAPQFSPDGERLLFTRFSPGDEGSEICVMPALGGVVVPVLSGAVQAVWSPDGTRMACVIRQRHQPQKLAVAAADGSGLRLLATANSEYPIFRDPAWSPDGTTLAVARGAGGEASEIWAVQTSDGRMRRLWADPPGVYSAAPAFWPDGSGIVHVSNRAGAANLWLMPVRGRAPVQLTSGPGSDLDPSVSRKGLIAFTSVRTRSGLWVYDLAAGTRRQIASHSKWLWAPAISPDGLDVAYSRAEEDGAWHIWIVPTQGGEPRKLTSSALPEVCPRFSPDSNWVTYCTWSPQADRIWRVPRRGGPAEPLTPERNDDDQYADVSPDGRQLVFARTEAGDTHIFVETIGSTKARQVTRRTSTLPRWSPDGRWIAFALDRSNPSGVFVVSAEGGVERRLSESGGWPVWWPDGRAVAYSVVGFDNHQRVHLASTGGPLPFPEPVFPVTTQNTPFDISRDGRTLVITDGDVLASGIWILEPRDAAR